MDGQTLSISAVTAAARNVGVHIELSTDQAIQVRDPLSLYFPVLDLIIRERNESKTVVE